MKRVAFFDFDNTIITGDAFLPFLRFACGAIPVCFVLGEALVSYAFLCAQKKNPTDGLRTFAKSLLLRHLLKGKKRDSFADAIAKTCRWQKINEPVLRTLCEHRANGDTIVIVSGSLDIYLPDLLRDIPHDDVICTDVGVKDGVVTGAMINGNCVRQRKAERVKAWLQAQGPFDESFGYGNYPHDVPMLALVKHRIIV
jgi:HAD superfamily hydrolase (TIGR01490 family)